MLRGRTHQFLAVQLNIAEGTEQGPLLQGLDHRHGVHLFLAVVAEDHIVLCAGVLQRVVLTEDLHLQTVEIAGGQLRHGDGGDIHPLVHQDIVVIGLEVHCIGLVVITDRVDLQRTFHHVGHAEQILGQVGVKHRGQVVIVPIVILVLIAGVDHLDILQLGYILVGFAVDDHIVVPAHQTVFGGDGNHHGVGTVVQRSNAEQLITVGNLLARVQGHGLGQSIVPVKVGHLGIVVAILGHRDNIVLLDGTHPRDIRLVVQVGGVEHCAVGQGHLNSGTVGGHDISEVDVFRRTLHRGGVGDPVLGHLGCDLRLQAVFLVGVRIDIIILSRQVHQPGVAAVAVDMEHIQYALIGLVIPVILDVNRDFHIVLLFAVLIQRQFKDHGALLGEVIGALGGVVNIGIAVPPHMGADLHHLQVRIIVPHGVHPDSDMVGGGGNANHKGADAILLGPHLLLIPPGGPRVLRVVGCGQEGADLSIHVHVHQVTVHLVEVEGVHPVLTDSGGFHPTGILTLCLLGVGHSSDGNKSGIVIQTVIHNLVGVIVAAVGHAVLPGPVHNALTGQNGLHPDLGHAGLHRTPHQGHAGQLSNVAHRHILQAYLGGNHFTLDIGLGIGLLHRLGRNDGPVGRIIGAEAHIGEVGTVVVVHHIVAVHLDPIQRQVGGLTNDPDQVIVIVALLTGHPDDEVIDTNIQIHQLADPDSRTVHQH